MDLADPQGRIAQRIEVCRIAAAEWAGRPVQQRLRVLTRVRRLIAREACTVASAVDRSVADTLVAEVLPLLEALRFLEREAVALLRPRRLAGGRPLWLAGVSAEVRREALGVVLILAPGNYPLFLPGAQTLQALAAGNAVFWKPAPEGVASAQLFGEYMARAGLPHGILEILNATDGAAAAACRFDRIVLTGSADTGRRVLQAAAAHLTPTTLELSGCDAVFILNGADLGLTARCLAYGLRFNAGATCIAPRRVFCPRDRVAELEDLLLGLLPKVPDAVVPERHAGRLRALLQDAVARGARLHHDHPRRPALVFDANPHMPLLKEDVFAPWLAVVPVDDEEQALRDDALCPYALGSTIFGPVPQARRLARRLRAGSICINDLIVPTADPRLAFGGRDLSGFGRTRGAEGLLEMTTSKCISVRRGAFRPHLKLPRATDALHFARMIAALHGGWRSLRSVLKA